MFSLADKWYSCTINANRIIGNEWMVLCWWNHQKFSFGRAQLYIEFGAISENELEDVLEFGEVVGEQRSVISLAHC